MSSAQAIAVLKSTGSRSSTISPNEIAALGLSQNDNAYPKAMSMSAISLSPETDNFPVDECQEEDRQLLCLLASMDFLPSWEPEGVQITTCPIIAGVSLPDGPAAAACCECFKGIRLPTRWLGSFRDIPWNFRVHS